MNINPLTDDYRIEAEEVLRTVEESISKSTIFQSTGGVHSASIFTNFIMKGFGKDIGRHNAVDKAISSCLADDIQLCRTVLVTSGRQTTEIVMKAARCRIPISVSMRAPLSSGV